MWFRLDRPIGVLTVVSVLGLGLVATTGCDLVDDLSGETSNTPVPFDGTPDGPEGSDTGFDPVVTDTETSDADPDAADPLSGELDPADPIVAGGGGDVADPDAADWRDTETDPALPQDTSDTNSAGGAASGSAGSSSDIDEIPTPGDTTGASDPVSDTGGIASLGDDIPFGATPAAGECPSAPPACSTQHPTRAGGPFVPIDRCAFSLVGDGFDPSMALALVGLQTALPSVRLPSVVRDTNRSMTRVRARDVPGNIPGFKQGFGWNAGDMAVKYWIPQGISGTPDAGPGADTGGRKVALVSWFHDKKLEKGATFDKGVRLAIVDTSRSPPRYRFVMLVEPMGGARPDFKAVKVHAGGIAWVGNILYVADTKRGLRLFDLTTILRVNGGKDGIGYNTRKGVYQAAGYKYVIPQIGMLRSRSACGPRFSFVSVDRTSSPPSLVTGEYCNGSSACSSKFAGRLFRWPLDPGTGLPRMNTTYPTEAFYSARSHMQGAGSVNGQWYISSSAGVGWRGVMYHLKSATAAGRAYRWVDAGPEDVMFDTQKRLLWSLSERAGHRYVFSRSLLR